MNRGFHWMVTAAAFLLAIATRPVMAEEPDVMEILQKADTACKELTQVAYDAEFFGAGSQRAVERMGHITAKVKTQRARRGLLSGLLGGGYDQMHVEGTVRLPGAGETLPFIIACDGNRGERYAKHTRSSHSGFASSAERNARLRPAAL